jgi:hypothetical protein
VILDHRTNRSEPAVAEPASADDPRTLTPEEREAWHREQDLLERDWLDRYIRALRPYVTAA